MRNYLNNLKVQTKVVVLISSVVFVLLTAVLAVVWWQSRLEIRGIIHNDLKAREQAFESVEKYRIRERGRVASLIASKSIDLLRSTDAKPADHTDICKFLGSIVNYTGSDPDDNPHIDFVSLQGKDGSTIAFVVNDHSACDSQLANWRLPDVSAALDPAANPKNYPLMTTWESPEGKLYTVFAARIAASSADQAVGVASFGYLQDDGAAIKAKQRATTDIAMWHEESKGGRIPEPVLIGVSNPALAPVLKKRISSLGTPYFESGGNIYVLEEVPIRANGVVQRNPEQVHTALVECITDRLHPFIVLERYLVVLAVCCVLLGIGLGAIFSRPIVDPLVGLASVARDVEGGNYDGIQRLKHQNQMVFESRDEIGILCRAFEEMVAGLKQRQIMSRYMSQSAYNVLGRSATGQAPSERKWMAVLFSDIRGFTSFSEGRDPQVVVQRLNEVLGLQADAVTKHQGDIDKFVGDAMVAWFDGPERCRRAVESARQIFQQMKSCKGDSIGGVGIGLHVGEVIVGTLGSHDRLDYTAIGSTVNLAARLCSAAKAGQLLITQAVATELADKKHLRPLPAITVKGFGEPVPVYEVLDATNEVPDSTSPVLAAANASAVQVSVKLETTPSLVGTGSMVP
jgi:class 3 adenylate cyclase